MPQTAILQRLPRRPPPFSVFSAIVLALHLREASTYHRVMSKFRALLSNDTWPLVKAQGLFVRRQALISGVTRRTRRRERIETKAISMKATRCPSVRLKIVFNRR